MFDLFAPSHLLLIAIAILVFVGPKDLPRFMHMAGKWTKKVRNLADEFREGLNNMEQQVKLDELRKEIAALRSVSHTDMPVGCPINSDTSAQTQPIVTRDPEPATAVAV